MMWLYTDASLLDNFSSNFLCLVDFSCFLNAWFGCEVFKQGLVENAPSDDPPLYGYIPHKFYTFNLSWSGKNITTDNHLHSLRNLLITCLLSLKEKVVLEYTPLQMMMTLLFPLVCSNIHNQCLCIYFHPNFHRPHFHCLNFHATYFLPVGPLHFHEHLFHVD